MPMYCEDVLADESVEAAPDDLAQRLAGGSRDALAESYQRFAPLVYNLALLALADQHDAEDVTQQVFVSAWASRQTLRADGSVAAWLVGITRHRIADVRTQRYRSQRNTAAVAATTAVDAMDPPQEELAGQLLVAHELDHLGEPRGTVVRMAVIEDRPHDEIARELDLPLGTVKSHVRRGLLQLRSRLEEVEHVSS
jgi:RNA polymerase sigma-70 factor (ECF subfamily)